MNPHNIQLGQAAIELGFLSREQAHYCLQQCAGGGSLLDVATSHAYLSREQAQRILSQSLLQHSQQSSSMAPELGHLFQGYKVTQILGQGGMGTVFKVEKDNAVYALKTIIPERSDMESLARFEREALAAATVDMHRNIVSVHKLELNAETPFIVMDYVEGQGLDQLIIAGEPWALEDVKELLLPLASALDHMHGKGVVHRDLKPANILIRGHDGAPMITDFGLAKEASLEALTRTGEMLGTPSYMAPEQFLGEPCSPQTDVWAFAIIAFELLSGGHRPFEAESSLALAQRAMLSEPSSLIAHNESCPIDVETVLFKAFRKSPQDRYESCGLFAEDFVRAVRGDAILGRREGFARRKGRKLYQKLGVAGLVSLCVLVLASVGMGVYLSLSKKKVPSPKVLAAYSFLKKNKEQHFKQHLLWELGVARVQEDSCSPFHEGSKLIQQSSIESSRKQIALAFLPCYPKAEVSTELVRGLKGSDATSLKAFFALKNGQYRKAQKLIKVEESNYGLESLKFLSFVIHCQLKDYGAALTNYDGSRDLAIPKEIRMRLEAHRLINRLKENARKLKSTRLTSADSELFKKYHELGEQPFIDEWGIAANAYFNDLLRSGSAQTMFLFHKYCYELSCSIKGVKELTVNASHLRKMLQLDKGSRVDPNFLILHYQLQKLDPTAQLSAKAYQHFCKEGRISAMAIQAFTRHDAFIMDQNCDNLIDLLYFCSRVGIYVENFQSEKFRTSFSKKDYIEQRLAKYPWDPALKVWFLYYNTAPQSFAKTAPKRVKKRAKYQIPEMFASVIESKFVPSVYRSILLYKRAFLRLNENNNVAVEEKAALRKLVLEDLRAAYKIGYPSPYRTGMTFRQAMTFGLQPNEIRALRQPILDQFDEFSNALNKQVNIGPKSFKLGDSLCCLDPIENQRRHEIGGAQNYERAQAHFQLEEYETSLKILLGVYKNYASLSILKLISKLVKKLDKVELVSEVLQRIGEIVKDVKSGRKKAYAEIAIDLKKHFESRK